MSSFNSDDGCLDRAVIGYCICDICSTEHSVEHPLLVLHLIANVFLKASQLNRALVPPERLARTKSRSQYLGAHHPFGPRMHVYRVNCSP